ISAAAIRCVGGDMQGRLVWRSDEERIRAEKMGIKDTKKIYTAEELAQGEVMFAATGVTSGDFLRGVRFFGGGCETHAVIMRIKYSIKMKEERPSKLSWTFISGEMMKDNQGSWTFEAAGPGKTKATYTVEMALGALVPKTIVNALVETSLPKMLEATKKR